MDIENYPTLLNSLVAFATLFPLLVMFYMYKAKQPKYYGLIIWGIALVAWASYCFNFLSHALNLMNGAVPGNHDEKTLKEIVVANLQVWVYIMPAVTAAVGANLITQFLISKKPNNS